MKILGITGGVGAGKSTVLSYMEQKYGARVIQADLVAFGLQQPGTDCFEKIIRLFGSEIQSEDGSIDRKKLAAVVFADKELLSRLNQIVHPAVKEKIWEEIRKEREQNAVPFVVVEAALLLEDHYDEICDEIWYIYTEPSVRAARLAASRGYSEEKIRQIMKNQLCDEEYRKEGKFVIDNSSDFVENTYDKINRGLIEHGCL